MKKTIIFLLIAAAAVTCGYFYLYKGHRDIANEPADYTATTAQFQQEFAANDSLANARYLDKTVVVTGKVTGIDEMAKSIIVDQKLTATFGTASASDFKTGQDVTIKGRFIGYDDLLEEFRMDQISIEK